MHSRPTLQWREGWCLKENSNWTLTTKYSGVRSGCIGIYYKPHENDEHSLNALENALNRLGNRDEQVVLARDFNLPPWNVTRNVYKENCHHSHLYKKFIKKNRRSKFYIHINQPTRENNTSDLVMLNIPSKIGFAEVIPGISDHECPTIEIDTRRVRKKIISQKDTDI